MNKKKIININGFMMHRAIVGGIRKVVAHQDYLNKINVFPVPDGDTGTNLLFTLRPVIKIKNDIPEHLGEAISLIANTYFFILYFKEYFKPSALKLFDTIRLILIGEFLVFENCINFFKFVPLPEINTAVNTLFFPNKFPI